MEKANTMQEESVSLVMLTSLFLLWEEIKPSN